MKKALVLPFVGLKRKQMRFLNYIMSKLNKSRKKKINEGDILREINKGIIKANKEIKKDGGYIYGITSFEKLNK